MGTTGFGCRTSATPGGRCVIPTSATLTGTTERPGGGPLAGPRPAPGYGLGALTALRGQGYPVLDDDVAARSQAR